MILHEEVCWLLCKTRRQHLWFQCGTAENTACTISAPSHILSSQKSSHKTGCRHACAGLWQVADQSQTSCKPVGHLLPLMCITWPWNQTYFFATWRMKMSSWHADRCRCNCIKQPKHMLYSGNKTSLCHPLPLVTQRGPSHSNLVFGILNKSEMLYQAKLSRLQRHWLSYPIMTANFAQHQSDFWQLNYRSSLPQWPQVT